MTKEIPELRWVGPPSLAGLFARSELRRSIEAYWRDDLTWRWAEAADWPAGKLSLGDFAHARKGGFGFVADTGSSRLFVVPRGWEEPEWEAAEIRLADGRWRDLGFFEPWSPTWVRPEPRRGD
jgi:hypothetical protein